MYLPAPTGSSDTLLLLLPPSSSFRYMYDGTNPIPEGDRDFILVGVAMTSSSVCIPLSASVASPETEK